MSAPAARKGTSGKVLNGYRVAARVAAWSYKPEPPHGSAPPGAGTVDVTLEDVDALWLRGDRFVLELKSETGAILRWEESQGEMLSDTQFVVNCGPNTPETK